jgi:AcrR family transcriptional regulator
MVSREAKLLKGRSQDKRRRIEAAALALFTTQGFHGTNNREIAKRAGVSTAAIYTHYPSKEALFTTSRRSSRWSSCCVGGCGGCRPGLREAKDLRKPSKGSEGQKLLEEAMQSRIDFIRLLSGRMWSTPPEIPAGKSRAREPAAVPMLFLPKISRDRPDDTQLRIEAAALELFTTQGFHGTNIREIAEKAGVSQGAIYTYYSSKGALFEKLVKTYRACMNAFHRRAVMLLIAPFSRDGLKLLAMAIRSMVYDDAQHWLLLFIDILEGALAGSTLRTSLSSKVSTCRNC